MQRADLQVTNKLFLRDIRRNELLRQVIRCQGEVRPVKARGNKRSSPSYKMMSRYARTSFALNQRAEIPSESPLSEDLEGAKINRRLKIPPINQFDGSSDPNDFSNTFDERMAFYGHSDVAQCRFFCTCLQGTTLKWLITPPQDRLIHGLP